MKNLGLIVIGKLRSGGAALASALVPIGFSPGVCLSAPAGPMWRMDWDDYVISQSLLRGEEDALESHIRMCAQRSRVLDCHALYKNAYAVMNWPLFYGAVSHEHRYSYVVKMLRDEECREASLAKTYYTRAGGRELDALVTQCLRGVKHDRAISYESLVEDPLRELTALCDVLEIDPTLADIGARHIQEATTCPGE